MQYINDFNYPPSFNDLYFYLHYYVVCLFICLFIYLVMLLHYILNSPYDYNFYVFLVRHISSIFPPLPPPPLTYDYT